MTTQKGKSLVDTIGSSKERHRKKSTIPPHPIRSNPDQNRRHPGEKPGQIFGTAGQVQWIPHRKIKLMLKIILTAILGECPVERNLK